MGNLKFTIRDLLWLTKGQIPTNQALPVSTQSQGQVIQKLVPANAAADYGTGNEGNGELDPVDRAGGGTICGVKRSFCT